MLVFNSIFTSIFISKNEKSLFLSNIKMPQNISVLRYPGGKTRGCKKLKEILEENFEMKNIEILISPFFGGGSFEFYIQNFYEIPIVANDKFTPLYNFWNCAKNEKKELCEDIRKKLNVDKEQFLEYRNEIMSLDDNPLLQASHYFIINRCSFNGSTLSGGFSLESSKKRFTPSSIDRIENLDLANVEFHNEDFADFLETESVRNLTRSLIFLDPPYFLESGSTLYGQRGDLHSNFEHQKLFDILSEKKTGS
jgi:DNA adenine methylase